MSKSKPCPDPINRKKNQIRRKKNQTRPLPERSFSSHRTILSIVIVLFLISATLVVFWPVTHHQFLNLDDDSYVTENPQVKKGLTLPSILWGFTSAYAGNWHPLTWLSHMLDYQLHGLSPGGHHLTSSLSSRQYAAPFSYP